MVMRKLFSALLLFTLVIVFPGCNRHKEITGKEFIPREVLIDILVDLHLVDGVTNDRKFHRRYDADSIDIVNPVFAKYKRRKSHV